MSLGNSAEAGVLNLYWLNTNWAAIGDATGLRGSTVAGSFYVSLHTASPGEAGNQTTSEATFTNYARVAVARSGAGWTISGTAPTQSANAAAVTYPQCGASGNTVTDFAIGNAVSGASEYGWYGTLTASLIINNLITASFATGALIATMD